MVTVLFYLFFGLGGYEELPDLRHTSAMIMIRNDTNVETVKNVLGHSQLGTTERYLHFDYEISKIATENVIQHIFSVDVTEENQRLSL